MYTLVYSIQYIYIFGAKEEAVILVRYLHINFKKMCKIGPPQCVLHTVYIYMCVTAKEEAVILMRDLYINIPLSIAVIYDGQPPLFLIPGFSCPIYFYIQYTQSINISLYSIYSTVYSISGLGNSSFALSTFALSFFALSLFCSFVLHSFALRSFTLCSISLLFFALLLYRSFHYFPVQYIPLQYIPRA